MFHVQAPPCSRASFLNLALHMQMGVGSYSLCWVTLHVRQHGRMAWQVSIFYYGELLLYDGSTFTNNGLVRLTRGCMG